MVSMTPTKPLLIAANNLAKANYGWWAIFHQNIRWLQVELSFADRCVDNVQLMTLWQGCVQLKGIYSPCLILGLVSLAIAPSPIRAMVLDEVPRFHGGSWERAERDLLQGSYRSSNFKNLKPRTIYCRNHLCRSWIFAKYRHFRLNRT